VANCSPSRDIIGYRLHTTSDKNIVKTVTLSGILSIALGACSTNIVAQSGAPSAAGATPERQNRPQMTVREESDLVFNILSAEIAGRRGLVDIASENYSEAANATDDPRVTERAVKLALYGRNWELADSTSARWVALDPDNVEAWQHRAQASMHLKDVETATVAMERVVALTDEGPGQVIPSLVDSILQQSDADIGFELIEKLAERFPESADAQYGIGRFALSKGDRDLALESFERALAIDPDNVDTLLARARVQLLIGEGDASLEPLTDYLSRTPDDLSAQLGYTRLLIDSGKVDRAATHFDVIAKTFPDDADALYTIGLLALDIRRVNTAEEYLTTVVSLGKYLETANFYLGRIFDSRRDYREAIDSYLNVQGGDHFFDAQIRAAELMGQVGDVGEGQALFKKLRTFSDEKAVQIELINSESRMLNGNDMFDESLEVLSGGLDQYNNNPALLYSRALVAERLERRELFESDLKTVIEVQPNNGYALNALGYFLADRNERLDEAQVYLQKAYELLPDDAAVVDSLGWLYYRQGNFAESVVLLQKAHKLLPDPEIAAHLGEVLWVSGEQAEATAVWEEALRESPDDDLLNTLMKKYIR